MLSHPGRQRKAVLALEEKGGEGPERKKDHLEDLKLRELDKIAQRTKVRACVTAVSWQRLRDHPDSPRELPSVLFMRLSPATVMQSAWGTLDFVHSSFSNRLLQRVS